MSEQISVLCVGPAAGWSLPDDLERARAEVTTDTVEGAGPALSRLDGESVDAVVSEYDLPDRTGTEFLAAVREGDPDLPFVLVTAAGDERVASEAFSAGADDYFVAGSEDPAAAVADRVVELVDRSRERRAERRRARAAEAATEGLGIFDADGEFTFVNAAFAEMYDTSPAAMIGDHWENYASDRQIDVTYEEIRSTIDREGRWSGVSEAEDDDGGTFQAQVSLARLDDGNHVFVARDITEVVERERELEKTKQHLEAIIEASPLAIYVLDVEGRVERCNTAAEDLFGWTEDEIRGQPLPTVAGRREEFEDNVDATLSGRRIVGQETTRVTKSGEEVPVRLSSAPIHGPDGEVTGVVGLYEDVTEARERQERLAQSEGRYRTLVEMSPDPILVHRDGDILYANETFADLVDANDAEQVVGTHITAFLDPSEHADARETARATQRGERRPTSYRRVVRTLSGNVRHIATTSRPITYDGESAVLTIVSDRTERRRYERALATLHEYTREMLRTDTVESAAEVAVEAVDELLDLPGAAVYGLDEEANALSLLAYSAALEDEIAPYQVVERDGDSPMWNAFVGGKTGYLTDLESVDALPPDLPVETLVLSPVGTHGVAVTGWAGEGSIPETTVELFEILGANLEATLDRIRRREAIEERDERLAERTGELRRVNHLNTVIRDITESLLNATTGEEIERAVCEELADTGEYSFAWFGHRERADDPVVPATDSGTTPGVADWIRDAPPDSPLRELVGGAIRDGEPRSATGILGGDDWADERTAALKYNFRAVAAVPVDVGDGIDRALVIHAVGNDAFSDRELSVFDELGRLIAATMRSAEGRGNQLVETRTEVELSIADERLLLNRISARTGTTVTLDGVVPTGDSLVGFLSTSTDPDELRADADDLELVDSIEPLASREGRTLYELEGPRTAFFDALAEYDARLSSMSSTDGVTTVVVTLPEYLSVRSFVEGIRAEYPEADLRARRERDVSVDTALTLHDTVEEVCTERQYQALKTAYMGGFYEWPRGATNAELADLLDIASPTYQSHRRAAERKLVEQVFRSGH